VIRVEDVAQDREEPCVEVRARPPDQREALVLVGAEGVSYEEAATIMGCKVGTVKSRVSRARGRGAVARRAA
jgi:DNA-directed RNA polymerase specialized sigma24 family protein